MMDNKMMRIIGSSDTFCFDNGTFSYNVDLQILKLDEYVRNLPLPLNFLIEAVVKECASGTIERTRDTSLLVVRKPYTISLRKTITNYKRMVKNYITV